MSMLATLPFIASGAVALSIALGARGVPSHLTFALAAPLVWWFA